MDMFSIDIAQLSSVLVIIFRSGSNAHRQLDLFLDLGSLLHQHRFLSARPEIFLAGADRDRQELDRRQHRPPAELGERVGERLHREGLEELHRALEGGAVALTILLEGEIRRLAVAERLLELRRGVFVALDVAAHDDFFERVEVRGGACAGDGHAVGEARAGRAAAQDERAAVLFEAQLVVLQDEGAAVDEARCEAVVEDVVGPHEVVARLEPNADVVVVVDVAVGDDGGGSASDERVR